MTTLALSATTFVARDADWIFGELHDPKKLVGFVPGASLTRLTGPGSFEARLAIGFGPIQSHFNGLGRITASDARRRTASLDVVCDPATNLLPVSVHMAMAIAKRAEGAVLRMTFDVVMPDGPWVLAQPWLDPVACDLIDRTTRSIKQHLEEASALPMPPAA